MKYKSKITAIGSMVDELANDGNLIIIFNEDVKDMDLQDISILHTVSYLEEDIQKGDILVIGDNEFNVTSVGDVALKTLKELGHCTIKFDGDIESKLPGEIHVDGNIPKIKIDDYIIFK